MGTNIANIPNVITTAVDGSLVYVAPPGGSNPDPFEDAVMTKVNFFLPLQNQIDANETDISSNSDRITTLENSLTKNLDKAQSASYTITQTADSRITNFGFRQVSGTSTVSVGTTLGAEDVVSSREITGAERSIDVSQYSLAGRTLYITINSGSVDVAIFSRENLYEV